MCVCACARAGELFKFQYILMMLVFSKDIIHYVSYIINIISLKDNIITLSHTGSKYSIHNAV